MTERASIPLIKKEVFLKRAELYPIMNKKNFFASFKYPLLLLFISILCFIGALYLKEKENYDRLESKLTSYAEHKTTVENTSPPKSIPVSNEKSTEDYSSSTQKVLLQEPLDVKKEGTLWFDKQMANYLITLGKLNGVKRGDIFKIYDSKKVIGEIEVIEPLEKISIVEIHNISIDITKENLSKRYYKISLE